MTYSQINPTKVGGFLLLTILILLSGCNSSYSDCKHDCLRYTQNCSIEGSFCIPPPCNTNHICNQEDVGICINKCSGGESQFLP